MSLAVRLVLDLPEPGATDALAHGLAHALEAGDIVLLEGELGAGKTTLTRSLCTALGVPAGDIASPTYVLVHRYLLPTTCPVPTLRGGHIHHVDAYRLTSSDDLEPLGWDQFMQFGKAAGPSVLLIEWPSRIEASLPPRASCLSILLEHAGGDARRATIHIPPDWTTREAVRTLIDKPPTRCRTTGVWVSPASPSWPFASERARGADLFQWLSGGYSVPGPPAREDEEPENS